ncbi:MAG TPA: hypothetical protein VJ547_00320 [Candidatus Thermoplasmatota archaeon]|nr:hypothetical protein [Candidatus Thermoplasmatota archaeon]
MSTTSAETPRRTPPRAPRPTEGPLLVHTPAGLPHDSVETGPAWIKGPPPAYHLAEAGHLVEPGRVPVVSPVTVPVVAPVAVPVAAPVTAPPATWTAPIRCPKCREKFDWTLERPTTVTCPHCRTQGVLKGAAPTP